MFFQSFAIRMFAAAQSAFYGRIPTADDRGQATAEYSLVILGAAALALLVIAWASKTDKIAELLNKVIDKIINQVA